MSRNPALRPTRAPLDRGDLCASIRRIAITAAAGLVALFLATVFFWR